MGGTGMCGMLGPAASASSDIVGASCRRRCVMPKICQFTSICQFASSVSARRAKRVHLPSALPQGGGEMSLGPVGGGHFSSPFSF